MDVNRRDDNKSIVITGENEALAAFRVPHNDTTITIWDRHKENNAVAISLTDEALSDLIYVLQHIRHDLEGK